MLRSVWGTAKIRVKRRTWIAIVGFGVLSGCAYDLNTNFADALGQSLPATPDLSETVSGGGINGPAYDIWGGVHQAYARFSDSLENFESVESEPEEVNVSVKSFPAPVELPSEFDTGPSDKGPDLSPSEEFSLNHDGLAPPDPNVEPEGTLPAKIDQGGQGSASADPNAADTSGNEASGNDASGNDSAGNVGSGSGQGVGQGGGEGGDEGGAGGGSGGE